MPLVTALSSILHTPFLAPLAAGFIVPTIGTVAKGEWQKANESKDDIMAILLKINWVSLSSQPGAHQRVRHIGGVSGEVPWNHTQAEAIRFIEAGEFAYYVQNGDRSLSVEVGRTSGGQPFLSLGDTNDAIWFQLPAFPHRAAPKPAKP